MIGLQMAADKTFRLSPDAILSVSDALVAAEQCLMRYNGQRIQLDADPFKANFAPDFRRLLRAKRLLSSELTGGARMEIVSALEYAGIAVALHDGAPLLDVAPGQNMDFGDVGERVRAALAALGVDRRADGPRPPG